MRRVLTSKDMEKVSHRILHSGIQAEQPGVPDDYATRLVKYIPAEIVAAFLVIDGILKAMTGVQANLYWLVFLALLILTPLYTWRVTAEADLPVAYAQVVVSTLSFIVWVFAIGGPFNFLSWYQPVYGSILLILFTLIPPLVIGKK